jgi:preprotein translocase subunit SecG
MTLTILNIIYVCVAIAMIALILMQRGAGAQAGSGFGAGASATVFGARGAGNFLSKSTKWLAVAFFLLSLGIGIFITHGGRTAAAGSDLGVMGEVAAPSASEAAPAGDVPAAPAAAPAGDATPAASDVPAAPAAVEPAATGEAAPADTPAPAEAAKKDGNG